MPIVLLALAAAGLGYFAYTKRGKASSGQPTTPEFYNAQLFLLCWSKAPHAINPTNWSRADVTGYWNDRTRQAVASYQGWAMAYPSDKTLWGLQNITAANGILDSATYASMKQMIGDMPDDDGCRECQAKFEGK